MVTSLLACTSVHVAFTCNFCLFWLHELSHHGQNVLTSLDKSTIKIIKTAIVSRKHKVHISNKLCKVQLSAAILALYI